MEETLTKENYPDLTMGLESHWNTPCLICDYLEKCNIGAEFNPIGCPWLNHYLYLELEKG
jgi:hypothetical protein